MAQHNETGNRGEKIAVTYISDRGYEILHTNWRCNHKEIDIIAKTNDTIVFIEVKTRSGNLWKAPEESVDQKKRKLLLEAANVFLETCDENVNARFDVVTVEFINGETIIRHYPEAFIPCLND